MVGPGGTADLGRQRAQTRGGQFDGQWQAVEAPADRHDVRRVLVRQLEVRSGHPCPLDEELDGAGLLQHSHRQLSVRQRERQWGERDDVLDMHMQGDATRRDDLQGPTRIEKFAKPRRSREQVLDVVDDQQHHALAEPGAERVLGRLCARGLNPERLGDRRQNQRRIGERSEIDEPDAIWKGVSNLLGKGERQRVLPTPPGPVSVSNATSSRSI